LTGETSKSYGTPNDYALQLNASAGQNSQGFSTKLCNNSSCLGFQQFVYDSMASEAYIQYWMYGYTGRCPSGFSSDNQGNCFETSDVVSVPALPISDLPNVVLAGSSTGSTDCVSMMTGNGAVYSKCQTSVLGLELQWQSAEFNVLGDGNGDQAVFNSGVSMVVQLLIRGGNGSSGVITPNCLPFGVERVTSESNNMFIGACCVINAGNGTYAMPGGIQYSEGNPTAPSEQCPLAISQFQKPVAIRANTGVLWIDVDGNGNNTGLGIYPGTTPSLAMPESPSTGYYVVFEAAGSSLLWSYRPGVGGVQTTYGMLPGTSPSIAFLRNGDPEVAFQSSSGILSAVDLQTNAQRNTGYHMMAGTSPSIAVSPDGNFAIAFQGSDGYLYLYRSKTGNAYNTWLGLAPGTSPSLSNAGQDTYNGAFNAQGSGHLWTIEFLPNSLQSVNDTGYGMMPRTSPSIADNDGSFTFGQYIVAFQSDTSNGNSGLLYLYAGALGSKALIWTGQWMENTASPQIISLPVGVFSIGYQVAFEGPEPNKYLTLDVNGTFVSQNLGM
jgi:hypothetical protein